VDTQLTTQALLLPLQVVAQVLVVLVRWLTYTASVFLAVPQLTASVQLVAVHNRFGQCAVTKVDTQFGTLVQTTPTQWVQLVRVDLVFS
jgi:hypothetical protein